MTPRVERIGGVLPRYPAFLSAKNCRSTPSIPSRATGSASGVITVAKCSVSASTPGTAPLVSAFR